MNLGVCRYLSSWFFFKLAIGAILLATSWDVLTVSHNGIINVSLLMVLSFFPAAFARPLFRWFSFIDLKKIISVSFFCSAFIIFIESFFILSKPYVGLIINFVLWIFIFVIEVSCERWFATLSQSVGFGNIRKLSGISTSTAQLGVILGPPIVILMKHFGVLFPYYAISFILLLASVLSGITRWEKLDVTSSTFTVKSNPASNFLSLKSAYILAFALIWPTLAIFNISAPLLAMHSYHSINVAATMEVLLGVATIAVGLAHPYTTKYFEKRTWLVLLILILSVLLMYYFSNLLLIVFLGTFFTGLSFGYLRIELRAFLCVRFKPVAVGEIVAASNSWSAPLLMVFCFVFYLYARNSNGIVHGLTFAFPLSFALTAIVFFIVLFKDRKTGDVHDSL